eukprot:2610956-Amphidinium_carterae.1
MHGQQALHLNHDIMSGYVGGAFWALRGPNGSQRQRIGCSNRNRERGRTRAIACRQPSLCVQRGPAYMWLEKCPQKDHGSQRLAAAVKEMRVPAQRAS